mmetsp:Transcript_13346/g.44931  ORF Transcript_13346/g.44931 Transcript_13346/m.44931 type:complete len:225 (+) Transcript_13346:107-781(+)
MRSSPSPCQDAVPAMFLVGRRHLALALQLCGARGGGVVAASAFRGRHRRRAHRPGRRRRKGGARRRKGCRRGCLPGRGELGGAQARARAERPAAVAARRRRPDAGGVRTADGARAPSPSRLAGEAAPPCRPKLLLAVPTRPPIGRLLHPPAASRPPQAAAALALRRETQGGAGAGTAAESYPPVRPEREALLWSVALQPAGTKRGVSEADLSAADRRDRYRKRQ